MVIIKQFSLRIEEGVKLALEIEAKQVNRSLNQHINYILKTWVKAEGDQPQPLAMTQTDD